ncbi:MAG: hypothetical protein IJB34_03715 [Clostridia bacterium]|nr:hypothetical protein [Clostridia bacterium]
MSEENKEKRRNAYRAYLSGLGIHELRTYARHIGVSKPTKEKPKNILIEAILDILTGVVPPVPPSSRGAPVKENSTDLTVIEEKIKEIDESFSVGQKKKFVLADGKPSQSGTDISLVGTSPNKWVLNSPEQEAEDEKYYNTVYKGQVVTVDGEYYLVPLDLSDMEAKIFVPQSFVRGYRLCEGDVVYCRAKKSLSLYQVGEILSVNETEERFERLPFAENTAQESREVLSLLNEKAKDSVLVKYLDWILPIGKGQRGLIVAPPKAGKSVLLKEIANNAKEANPKLCVFVLLIDQAPETVDAYRKCFSSRELVYTSFCDEAEKQVQIARLVLERAKRYVEMGRDVLFLLDSFSSLAQAYNETEESVGGKTLVGGLESKTLQFIREYFSTGRNIGEGGSFTLCGTVSVDTGNPADGLIFDRLSSLSNLKIVLNGELAKRREYPAIDCFASRNWSDALMATIPQGLERALNDKFQSDSKSCLEALRKSNSKADFYALLGVKNEC